jgi:hypothetical protein
MAKIGLMRLVMASELPERADSGSGKDIAVFEFLCSRGRLHTFPSPLPDEFQKPKAIFVRVSSNSRCIQNFMFSP